MIAQNDRDLLEFFIKNTALRKKILIVAYMDTMEGNYLEGLEKLRKVGLLLERDETQYHNLLTKNRLIFVQENLEIATDICDETHVQLPYCEVWENGEVVYENT